MGDADFNGFAYKMDKMLYTGIDLIYDSFQKSTARRWTPRVDDKLETLVEYSS